MQVSGREGHVEYILNLRKIPGTFPHFGLEHTESFFKGIKANLPSLRVQEHKTCFASVSCHSRNDVGQDQYININDCDFDHPPCPDKDVILAPYPAKSLNEERRERQLMMKAFARKQTSHLL